MPVGLVALETVVNNLPVVNGGNVTGFPVSGLPFPHNPHDFRHFECM